MGLHAAKIVALEFNRVNIPAFDALIVYYSIASNTESVSPFLTKLNSSIQHTPISAKTSAPASIIHSPPTSLLNVTVNPAEVDPIPVVNTDRFDNLVAYFKIYDFPVPGSPTKSKWHYPLILVLFSTLETPPIKHNKRANLMSFFSKISGQALLII